MPVDYVPSEHNVRVRMCSSMLQAVIKRLIIKGKHSALCEDF